ncbi:cytochrome C556 (plasmid) [Roseibium algicola]|uniref:Cytochrome C556 n=1 Tax=Roseibium algicola TaxID=2857014 RepID=A0ABN4X8Y7_9HYPH|nr:cytochrome c [Roseibium aggregatum]AQQ07915.1 cytochrome C556 [Roseibium aggregatum]
MLKTLLTIAFCLLAITSLALAEEQEAPAALVNLVRQDCGSCHGMTLKGGLGPDIRPDALGHYDIDTLSTVVLDGIPKTAMPPWRPILSEADARKIAEYLLKGDTK